MRSSRMWGIIKAEVCDRGPHSSAYILQEPKLIIVYYLFVSLSDLV
jgi:hypothetical protein